MKVTKYVHSCLLVETADIRVLVDPGGFSYESRMLNLREIEPLDYIVITHEHPDHYHEPFLKNLSKAFPHAVIVTNDDLAQPITKLKLPNKIQVGSDDNITVFEAEHEPLPLDAPNVLNVGVHIGDQLTHSGDSYQLNHTRDILALPLTGPFASYKQALDVIVKLKPKVVLPMHDWEWHNAARKSRYDRAKELLRSHDIEFIELENAKTVEL